MSIDRPVISIGRGTENDLIVTHDLASRQHLSVQFSRGRCTITDNSTNGTVIFGGGNQTSYTLKRDSFTLAGAGTIILGQPADVEEADAIDYVPL